MEVSIVILILAIVFVSQALRIVPQPFGGAPVPSAT